MRRASRRPAAWDTAGSDWKPGSVVPPRPSRCQPLGGAAKRLPAGPVATTVPMPSVPGRIEHESIRSQKLRYIRHHG